LGLIGGAAVRFLSYVISVFVADNSSNIGMLAQAAVEEYEILNKFLDSFPSLTHWSLLAYLG
jgi:hypothetical protein